LQSADVAKAYQHKQVILILNNASVPVNTEPEIHASVVKAWTVALEAMNNLVKRIPQRVQDGSALLAISSWHLYPDMSVFGESCVEIKQKDPIFDRVAILTLGLQHAGRATKSVYWSLPLVCLQHYGHPIQAYRTAGQENSRITCQQFAYIIMGCLFDGWDNFAATNEEGLKWVELLRNIVGLSTEHRIDYAHQHTCTWLVYLLVAARPLADLEEPEKKAADQLMKLGRRRSTFLHIPSQTPPPLFGLSQIDVLLPLLQSDQQRVEILRQFCHTISVDESDFLVTY
jgi:hypothetical protein